MSNLVANTLYEKLSAPFEAKDIEFRIGNRSKNEPKKVLIYAYTTRDAIQKRFNDVCGPYGWEPKYRPLLGNKLEGFICEITIYNVVFDSDGTVRDVRMEDGADVTEMGSQDVKGGFTHALKRTAQMFGVGMYLTGWEQVWITIENEKFLSRKEVANLQQWYTEWVNSGFTARPWLGASKSSPAPQAPPTSQAPTPPPTPTSSPEDSAGALVSLKEDLQSYLTLNDGKREELIKTWWAKDAVKKLRAILTKGDTADLQTYVRQQRTA